MILKNNLLFDDIGEIELVGCMGKDLDVVNSARISYGGQSEDLDSKDIRLLNYLAQNNHSSPFRHNFATFRIKAPEFVMRQWYKHVIGCSWTTPEFHNHGWNEISGRYKEIERKFYIPRHFHEQSGTNKQASAELLSTMPNDICRAQTNTLFKECYKTYEMMLNFGVSREQARIVLPLSMYTEVIWTASLQALHNFVELRNHEHAQYEIKLYAEAIGDVCSSLWPESWKALTNKNQ